MLPFFKTMKKKMHRKYLTLAIGLLAGAVLAAGCSKQTPPPRPAPAVSVVTAQTSSPLFYTELAGRVSAVEIAEVRPQVSGIILKRTFTEGDDVKEGDPLFVIDPKVYEAALAQAKAALAAAKADAARAERLFKSGATSRQALDQARSAYASAQAGLASAQANLDYTRVLSPVSGRVGRSEVTPGALVAAYQAAYLTKVVKLDPIYVDLRQASTETMRIKREMQAGIIKSTDGALTVTLVDENGKPYSLQGRLTYAGETVDASTGMINIRAGFDNPNKDLLPGMYVRARIEEGQRDNSILLSQRCVMRDPRGQAYVYVVGEDNKVSRRDVTANRTVKTDWLIESGLSAGERVVVEGLQSIRNGSVVRVTTLDGVDVAAQKAPSQAKAP